VTIPPPEAEFGEDMVGLTPASPSLRQALDPATVTIYGNVVQATEGTSHRAEVLGSGQSSVANQSFRLRAAPLSYVRAPTPSGVAPELTVKVDGVVWSRVEELYEAGPNSRVYMLSHADDGHAVITFGDGIHGARVPSGTDNVAATYRSGMSAEAPAAGQVRTLQSGPAGIESVSNPLPATPGAVPESMAAARHQAPLQVSAMGRVVSLRDFEDFTLAYPGVGKASASALRTRHGPLMAITVALSAGQGSDITPDEGFLRDLAQSLDAASGRQRRLRVLPYLPRHFGIGATVQTDGEDERALVGAAIRKALLSAFSVGQAAFGETIAVSDVARVIRGVAGVSAARVSAFFKTGKAVRLRAALHADSARWRSRSDTVRAAELLAVRAADIRLQFRVP
jgi:predicted phage baseplate assembly protein